MNSAINGTANYGQPDLIFMEAHDFLLLLPSTYYICCNIDLDHTIG